MLEGSRVLVADDDPVLLTAVAESLEASGAEVTRVPSGAELIERLGSEEDFDLIVTDVSMPWMTGLQAMHATRYAGLTTPVIVMTALKDPGLPEQVRMLGANAMFLRKPFGLADLEAAAAQLMCTLHAIAP